MIKLGPNSLPIPPCPFISSCIQIKPSLLDLIKTPVSCNAIRISIYRTTHAWSFTSSDALSHNFIAEKLKIKIQNCLIIIYPFDLESILTILTMSISVFYNLPECNRSSTKVNFAKWSSFSNSALKQ